MQEKIVVTLDGQGGIEMETIGFQGKVCEEVAQQIMVSMNGRQVEEEKRPEYFADGNDPVKVLRNC